MACYCPAFCFKASENKESSLVFVLGKQFMACLPGAARSDERTPGTKGRGRWREILEHGFGVISNGVAKSFFGAFERCSC